MTTNDEPLDLDFDHYWYVFWVFLLMGCWIVRSLIMSEANEKGRVDQQKMSALVFLPYMMSTCIFAKIKMRRGGGGRGKTLTPSHTDNDNTLSWPLIRIISSGYFWVYFFWGGIQYITMYTATYSSMTDSFRWGKLIGIGI